MASTAAIPRVQAGRWKRFDDFLALLIQIDMMLPPFRGRRRVILAPPIQGCVENRALYADYMPTDLPVSMSTPSASTGPDWHVGRGDSHRHATSYFRHIVQPRTVANSGKDQRTSRRKCVNIGQEEGKLQFPPCPPGRVPRPPSRLGGWNLPWAADGCREDWTLPAATAVDGANRVHPAAANRMGRTREAAAGRREDARVLPDCLTTWART